MSEESLQEFRANAGNRVANPETLVTGRPQTDQGYQMECLHRPPPGVPPAAVQMTGYALSQHISKGGSFEEWMSICLPQVLKQPETTSLLLDAEFVRMVGEETQWEDTLRQLRGNSAGITEYHVDLRLMDLRNMSTTVQRLRSLFHKGPSKQEDSWSQGHFQKLAIFGMTSQFAAVLSVIPKSLVELQLFFEEDRGEAELFDEQPDRRTRIEAMMQQHVATHPSLTAISIKYTEEADDLLPLSAFALATLIGCENMVKIEVERCTVSAIADGDGEAGALGEDEERDRDLPEQAVFQALRDNTMLFLLRFRAGSLQTSVAENIARALEVGNRSLRYIDMGDMEGVGETVASAITKAVLRNPVLCGLEMNLNSIQDFQFTSLGNLTCMDVSDNYLRDEGALQLAQLIPACRLERINLADNGIGRIGGSAIAWSLAHNSTITKINICNNPLLSSDPDAGGGPTSEITTRVFNSFNSTPAYQQGFLGMMCSGLRHNKVLTFINLANVGLDDSHGPLLSILLRVSGLVGMGLLRNRIGDQACIYMCQALSKYKTTLRALMLEMNPISVRGFYAMWKGVLSTNDTLMNVSWGNTTYMIKGVERGQRDLDISLKLNRSGMIRLRRDKNATKEEWVEALIQVRDDLDCSFTFLSENTPLLF